MRIALPSYVAVRSYVFVARLVVDVARLYVPFAEICRLGCPLRRQNLNASYGGVLGLPPAAMTWMPLSPAADGCASASIVIVRVGASIMTLRRIAPAERSERVDRIELTLTPLPSSSRPY